MGPIGVGIIGASAVRPGWATAVHIPTIAVSEDFVLRAVSTSSRGSAQAASEKFGVPAFDNASALVGFSGVDLVVVAVKVPHHHALIMQALSAGKAVFSEWPLAATLGEAEELEAVALRDGLYSAVGLQARFSPAIEAARAMVLGGQIGDVLGTTIAGSGMAWGSTTDFAHAYMFAAGSGASTISVPLMHSLDGLIHVLGDFDGVKAEAAVRRSKIELTDRRGSLRNTVPDHIALSGRLQSGAIASAYFRGGTSGAGNFRWEINGSRGDLLLTASNGNMQVADLELRCGRAGAILDERPVAATHNAMTANVARLYQAIAVDMRTGSRSAPDFTVAAARHRLLAAIEESARI